MAALTYWTNSVLSQLTVFTIIMTTRQMFSICISAAVFGHAVSFKAFAGASIVL